MVAGLLLPMLAPRAFADSMIVIPAEKFITTPGGVDLRTGRYAFNQVDISGPEVSGLKLARIMPDYVASHVNPFGNLSSNWDIFLLETRTDLTNGADVGNDYRMNIHIGGRSVTFHSYSYSVGYGYQGDSANQTLTFTSTKTSDAAVYTYVDADGSEMTFRPIGNRDCADQNWGGLGPRRCAYVSTIVQPDGTKLDFSYDYNAAANGNRARLARIVSSRGYALLFENNGTFITKACLINASRTSLPATNVCPSDAVATTSYTYATGSRLASATNPLGEVTTYTYTAAGSSTDMAIIKPGQTSPWLVNRFKLKADEEGALQEIIETQTFGDGQVHTFQNAYTPYIDSRPLPTIMGGSYSDLVGNSVAVSYDFPIRPGSGTQYHHCTHFPCEEEMPDDAPNYQYQVTPGPVEIQDTLGNSTIFRYCDPVAEAGLPAYEQYRCAVLPHYHQVLDPEEIKSDVKYDSCGNIREVKTTPKSGSPLALRTTSATFACGNAKAQSKPTVSVDPKGSATNYTYDTSHGGTLSEMQPPPSTGAARPLKLFTYVQRYAWIKNSSGTLVQAATPVWVPSTVTQCQTAAGSSTLACDGSAPQILTTNEYGATGTTEALLVKGVALTSGGVTQRTCYGYDPDAARISETQPNANLSACP